MSIWNKSSQPGFEIRLESIGGLGANLAGKMLAEAGVLGLGLNGAGFSSYGSEKKGSPVKSFVRFCDPELDIRDHSPVEQPDVIGVFHEALHTTVPVLSGLKPGGVVLVNSIRSFEEIRKDLQFPYGTLAVVDALGIALEERTRVNTSMLGALFRICDFLDRDSMRAVIKRTFEKKYPQLVEPNLRTFDRGYDEVRFETIEPPTELTAVPYLRQQPLLGYETQESGGIISAQGNSLLKDLSGSRQGYLPELNLGSCIHCANCDATCPDLCFVWEAGEDKRGRMQMFLQGIDYQYCKGCLKCVEVCPTGSLAPLREEAGYADSHRVAHVFN
ncbi:2-oxoacid:acceptor oxidoreductase family protein [Paenibacillus sp. M1]|uniref:2-oxoacid:acceptor oxidoreductase family protein n=1 Tax=Paenibacillus haidiansis TaxID=1574488 RepID=A0ABU7VY98_9BACL